MHMAHVDQRRECDRDQRRECDRDQRRECDRDQRKKSKGENLLPQIALLMSHSLALQRAAMQHSASTD